MKVKHGDILELARQGLFDVVVQGCNCFCTMDLGVARQIKQEYPEAYDIDCTTKKGDPDKLGNFTYVETTDNFIIVNAYTQFYYGTDKVYVQYDYLGFAFEKIKEKFKGFKIAYPKIGAGLAGGDWERISKIINEKLKGEDHTLVIYDK